MSITTSMFVEKYVEGRVMDIVPYDIGYDVDDVFIDVVGYDIAPYDIGYDVEGHMHQRSMYVSNLKLYHLKVLDIVFD